MSRQQYGFLVGFLVAALWAVAGFTAALAAAAAGGLGWLAGRVLDGKVDIARMVDRAGGGRGGQWSPSR